MPHDELDGLEVGAYTLERPLGHGGMGSVWLAHRTDGRFEGRVAVKLMNLALVESLAVERFRREGSLLARLTHPGIARLLDAGVAPTRQPYLVIEYIDGLPIDRYADLKALSVPDRLSLVLQVLDALSHAHTNFVVHRDIKPTNILVTPDGTVKLLDFGIGKLLGQDEGGDDSLLTAAGGRAFTPAFAAPEQVLGGPITMATDVYSVGVLVYLLVAGHHPMAAAGTGTRLHPRVERHRTGAHRARRPRQRAAQGTEPLGLATATRPHRSSPTTCAGTSRSGPCAPGPIPPPTG